MAKRSFVISEPFNGRTGIIPWFGELINGVFYPIPLKEIKTLFVDGEIIQIEFTVNNIFILTDKGKLYDLSSSIGNIKKIASFRKNCFVLDNDGVLYQGGDLRSLERVLPDDVALDMAKWGERLLFIIPTNISTSITTVVLAWSRYNIDYMNIREFWGYENSIAFPSNFVVLPQTSYLVLSPPYIILSDGIYFLDIKELAGTISVLPQKIFPLSQAKINFFSSKYLSLMSIGQEVYALQGERIEKTNIRGEVENFLSSDFYPVVRREWFKTIEGVGFYHPLNITVYYSERHLIIKKGNEVKIYEKSEDKVVGRMYIIDDFAFPKRKYLRKIFPLRFQGGTRNTTNRDRDMVSPPFSPPLNFQLDDYTLEEQNIAYPFTSSRAVGEYFIMEIIPDNPFQTTFEVEFDEGK